MREAVHSFFSQWEIYRLCIGHNTLFHREVGEILRRELIARMQPLTFLDLACGDADLTAIALRGSKVGNYTGVDFSAPAVALAANKIAELEPFDVIYLGLSLHHLQRETKHEMMKNLKRATAPGGIFYLFEPVLHSGVVVAADKKQRRRASSTRRRACFL